MRCVVDGLAVFEDDGLRGLVFDAGVTLDLVRDSTVSLDNDDIDLTVDQLHVSKDACADAAARAVLKEQHRSDARFFYCRLQFIKRIEFYEVRRSHRNPE